MIPTTQDVKDTWNSFAEKYAQVLEKPNLQVGLSLARMAGVHSAQNILEIACGSGELTLSLLQSLPHGTKYLSIDISEEMIRMANFHKEAVKDKLNNIEHEFLEADGENLSFIPDESVDVVLAPLCLHLTPDPNKILQEALRVLKKGGKIGISVLGDAERCTFFSILDTALSNLGIGQGKSRGIFYLGSREKLINLARDNGVKVDFCWTEAIPFAWKTKEELIDFWFPNYNPNRRSSNDQTTQVLKQMEKIFDEKMKNFIPLQTEDVLLIGTKPF